MYAEANGSRAERQTPAHCPAVPASGSSGKSLSACESEIVVVVVVYR